MITATAPASSANLGPGYDVMALALDLRCRVGVVPASEWEVLSGGSAAGEAATALIHRVATEAVPDGGPFCVEIESTIPRAGGLGSSAAIIAATAAAMRRATDGSTDAADLFGPAARAEGHPDNVAAALFGGLVMVSPRGVVRRLAMDSGFRLLVAVPEGDLLTEDARKATADPVATVVASRTAARLAFLIEGLRTGDREALTEALGDELHEERRAHLAPMACGMIDAARGAGAAHAAWSGAGPSVVAFVTDDVVGPVEDALRRVLAGSGEILRLDVAETGVEVE